VALAPSRLRTPWRSVYHYFRRFRLDETWERVHAALRERVRIRLKRNPQPSAGVVDSQSVKSTGVGGEEERGYDGGKKVKGSLSATCSWTQKASCSLGQGTHSAKVLDFERASKFYWIVRKGFFRAFLTCGWTEVTRERTRVETG
jgi:hypothetical protein